MLLDEPKGFNQKDLIAIVASCGRQSYRISLSISVADALINQAHV